MYTRNQGSGYQLQTVLPRSSASIALLLIVLVLSSCIHPIQPEFPANLPASQKNIEVVGHIGGGALSVAVQGDYAYLGFSHELMVLNIHDPSQPRWLTSLRLPATHLVLDGQYAYVVGRAGFAIVDLADPANPRQVGAITNVDIPSDVAFDGQYAYFIAGSRLYTVDVSNKKHPTILGAIKLAPYPVGLLTQKGFVYVTSDAGLFAVNVSNPAQPVVTAQIALNSSVGRAAFVGDYLYTVGNGKLAILSITTPATPKVITEIDRDSALMQLVTVGNFAYMASEKHGLQVWDISDSPQPIEIATYPVRTFAYDVTLKDGYLYLVDLDDGLQIFKVLEDGKLAQTGTFSPLGLTMASIIGEQTAYTIGGWAGDLHCIDLNNPSQSQEIKSHLTVGFVASIAYIDPYLYVMRDDGHLGVYDISSPKLPRIATYYFLPYSEIFANEAVLYVSDRRANLAVIDITDPMHLQQIADYPNLGHVGSMTVSDGFAYLFHQESGMHILKIGATGALTEVGLYNTTGELSKIVVSGNYAYLARGSEMQIVDVSDPTAPFLASRYPLPDRALDMALMGNRLLVAASSGGLRVLNIANPTQPFEAGFYQTLDCATHITIADDLIYLSDHFSGLWILRLHNS